MFQPTSPNDVSTGLPPATPGSRKILVLYAHPSQERSEVNRHIAAATTNIAGVTLVDLYAEYPSLDINADREQARLLAHDVIVFLHPLYWYSTPAILKEWQDMVLEHGFAYGNGGDALHGKIFFNALSAGGPEQAYRAKGYNHYTIRELLHPLEQMASLCGMQFLPPFAIFGARTAAEEHRLEVHIENWRKLLTAIRDDRLDLGAVQPLPDLSHNLEQYIRVD